MTVRLALAQFDVVLATFQPQRADDLREEARQWVGRRLRWCAGWVIEDGPYAGQLAWMPHEPPSDERYPGWVPTEDLTDIERER